MSKFVFGRLKPPGMNLTRIRKLRARNWKSVKGVCRFLGPVFLNKGGLCNTPFENWLRVNGSKFNVLSQTLKNSLSHSGG